MADLDSQTEPAPVAVEGYQVVARRYRPQTFDELIGQEHVAKALKQALSTGRIGHAYLFTGARGVGKTSAARVLAKALNCVHGPTPAPCNACEVCRSVTLGDDVDVIEIDGASNRQIDDIRQLRQNVAIRPSRVRYKVYIIDEVHMLTKEAFNALLKTLEEPPEHVKFIFATTDPQKVPITILSRCQRFDFAGIESASIARRLKQIAENEGVEIDDDALAVLSIRAAGSMRDSQSLLEQLLAVAGKRITASEVYHLLGIAPSERIERLVEAVVDRDAARALANLDEAIADGADVGQMVDQLLGHFRDVMAMTVGCDTSQLRYVLPGQYDRTQQLGAKLGVHTVLAMIQVLDQTASRMRGSLHTRTLAEMAVVRLAHLDDLDELSAAVAELRSHLPAAAGAPPSLKKNVSERPPVAGEQRSSSPQPFAPAAGNLTNDNNSTTRRVDAPAVPGVPVPATLTTESVKAAWKQMTARLEGLLASQAEQAYDVQLAGDGNVVVRFAASDQFSKDMCNNPANRSQLEQSLADQVGGPVSLKFEVDAAAAYAATTAAVAPRVTSRRQLQAQVADRPFVARAMELFAADVGKLRVTPPRDERPPDR